MDANKIPNITPKQEEGKQNDLQHIVTLNTIEDAEELFLIGKDRLLDMNNWDKYAGGLSGVFTLTDAHGKELHRKAHKGDYVKIMLPAPGEHAGQGYDWVHIEELVYDDFPDENREIIAMTVYPTAAPNGDKEDTSHFFTNKASSTYSIQRDGKEVMATYHGRNEIYNTETTDIIDKARNMIVATAALMGMSELQWKNLIKGFLDMEQK